MKSVYLRWAAFAFALFHIYCNVFASISELWLSAIHFGGFCAICALMANESDDVENKSFKFWVNMGLALVKDATSKEAWIGQIGRQMVRPTVMAEEFE